MKKFLIGCALLGSTLSFATEYKVVAKCNWAIHDSLDVIAKGDAVAYVLADAAHFSGDWSDANAGLVAWAGEAAVYDTLQSTENPQPPRFLQPASVESVVEGRPTQIQWSVGGQTYGFAGGPRGEISISTNARHPQSNNVYPVCYFQY